MKKHTKVSYQEFKLYQTFYPGEVCIAYQRFNLSAGHAAIQISKSVQTMILRKCFSLKYPLNQDFLIIESREEKYFPEIQ